MIFTSGKNLESGALNFIENQNSVILFSAYITLEELKRLNIDNKIKQIVVRWDVQDLCLGVSDLEVYNYCKSKNIPLFRNTRLHLKVIWDGNQNIFFGSANVTRRGLGEKGKYNYELNGTNNELLLSDMLYLNLIIKKSQIVDDSLYQKLKNLKEEFEPKEISYPKLDTPEVPEKDRFLLSQLPMSKTPEFLFKAYFNRIKLDSEDLNCLLHDLALFDISLNLSGQKLESELKVNFNNHPFIIALKKRVKENKSMNYGGVVKWIQKNTTTVPTPRSWELKREQIVNILYEWICFFDSDFYWNVPGKRSEVIYYRNNSNA